MRRSHRHDQQPPAVTDAEQIARYLHLVRTLPESVVVKAHAAAFTALSVDQRTELLDSLRPLASEADGAATSEHPDALALLVRDPRPRDQLMRTDLAGAVARQFVESGPVAAYFTVGLGSVTIDEQPPWVNELAHHESAPIDAGNLNHRAGIDFRPWR